MQDPDWIELCQEWDRLFQVSLPTIRVTFPGLPTRLVPDPAGPAELPEPPTKNKRDLIPVVLPQLPVPTRQADEEDEAEEEGASSPSVSLLREKFNIGTEWTEPALLAQRAAEEQAEKDRPHKVAPWVRTEAAEAPVERSAAFGEESLEKKEISHVFRGRAEKPFTPPLLVSSPPPIQQTGRRLSSKDDSSSSGGRRTPLNHRGELSPEVHAGSPGSVKSRIQELMKNSRSSPVGSSKSSTSTTEWAFKKKQLSSGRPFLEAPATAGTIPFAQQGMMDDHSLSSLLLRHNNLENVNPDKNISSMMNSRAIYAAAAGQFRYMHAKKRLGLGVYLVKLQEGKPGRVSPCLVGIDFVEKSLWWKSKGLAHSLPLKDLVEVEYGMKSACFKKTKPNNTLPWNCLTVVFRQRCLNFFADRKMRAEFDPKTGRNRLISVKQVLEEVASDKLGYISEEVDSLLFGLSQLFREERKILGHHVRLFKSYSHLRFSRCLIKLDYLASLRYN
jgi:hypothetical protein